MTPGLVDVCRGDLRRNWRNLYSRYAALWAQRYRKVFWSLTSSSPDQLIILSLAEFYQTFLTRNHSNLSIQFGKVIVRAERCKASKSMCGLWLCKRASLTNSRTISTPIKTSACSFVEIWGDFLTQKLHTEPQRAARKHSMVLRAAHIGKATTRICTWSSESTSEINQREQFISRF